MAKAGRGQTRRDSKRRVLRPGESVRAYGQTSKGQEAMPLPS